MLRYGRACLWLALAALTGGPARAQDPSLGGAAVGADAGAYLGAAFSNLPFYHDGQGTMVGGLAGAVLGTLGLAPIGAAPTEALSTPPAAKPPVAMRIECRNFTDSFMVDGKPQEVKGTICKQPDGSWKVQP
jgi:surface antigen